MNQPKKNKLYLVITVLFFIILSTQSYLIYKLYQRDSVKPISSQDNTVKNDTLISENLSFYWTPLPAQMDFCGEPVPMNDPEVMERLQTEWIAATNRQLATWTILFRSTRYFPIIEPILKKNNVPDDIKYLAVAESYLANVVSPSDAEGFWQFLKGTAISYGLDVTKSVDQRYDVELATEAACKYLSGAYRKFGSWTLAAASYNMGQGGLNGEMETQKQHDYYKLRLNAETGKYVFRILTLKYVLQNPASVGLQWDPSFGQVAPATKSVEVSSSIGDLVQWSIDKGTDYRMVRYLNPWIRSDHLDVPSGKTYKVLLPAN